MLHRYGIKIVWPGGSDRDVVIGFSSQGYRTWKSKIGIGTRMLIYEAGASELDPTVEGRMAIIGEVEVTGGFRKDEFNTPSPKHPWLVPVKAVGVFPCEKTIPRTEIRKVIAKPDFPEHHETWHELSEAQYQKLVALLR